MMHQPDELAGVGPTHEVERPTKRRVPVAVVAALDEQDPSTEVVHQTLVAGGSHHLAVKSYLPPAIRIQNPTLVSSLGNLRHPVPFLVREMNVAVERPDRHRHANGLGEELRVAVDEMEGNVIAPVNQWYCISITSTPCRSHRAG